MLTNIFKKKTKRKSIKIKPKIIVDVHEKNSLVPSYLAEKGTELDFKSLKIGDYLINKIVIERKTFSDLIGSMISKRLIQQLKNLNQTKSPLLIIEGKHKLPEHSSVNPNSYRGLIISVLTQYQIPIIYTKDERETATYLILLAKQQLKPIQEISLHSRIPKTKKEQQKYLLESFPTIGPKAAENLLKHFKTPLAAFNASEDELKSILKSKSKIFKDILEN